MKRLLLACGFFGFAMITALAGYGETKGIWLDVPFVKQTENGCGSASLSMLLQYWSEHGATVAPDRADPDAIQRALYSPKLHGITSTDMQKYLTESGFQAFAFQGTWNDLEEHLSKGRPLIVSLHPQHFGPYHYVVVVGMDWQNDAVFVNDPARGKLLRLDRQKFEKEWSAVKTSDWMLLAVPAGVGRSASEN